MKAIWNGQVIAESTDTIVVDGNHYFPHEKIHPEYFRSSDTHTTCYWKGIASYYTLVVDGKENQDAAWYYPHAQDKAKYFEGRVAFWKGVEISE